MSIDFRNVGDLNDAVLRALPRLPRDLDLVVGIPRSGLLAANVVALYLNLPLTDLDGFLEGRIIGSGRRQMHGSLDRGRALHEVQKNVLVIDDSVWRGQQMREARARIDAASLPHRIWYSAVYALPESEAVVDFAFERLSWSRCFGWNVMHHALLEKSCVDIDGVLCVDPTPDQNDDGPAYERFLRNAEPLHIPSVDVGWLVTGRLERYRHQTEDWLHRHGVRYGELLMLDAHDGATRRADGLAVPFKARVYRDTSARMFVESSRTQADGIARLSRQSVLCLGTQEMVEPSVNARVHEFVRSAPRSLAQRGRRAVRRSLVGPRAGRS